MQLTRQQMDVIEILAQDARLSAQKVAVMAGLDVAEVQEIIDQLEKANVLVGYPALINWEATPVDSVEAMIEVRVTPQAGYGYDAIAEQIMHYESVKSVYLMSGAYDLQVRVKAANLKELAMFVSQTLAPIEGVLSTATHFVLKKYKSQGMIIDKQDDRRQAVSM